jgi:hypothetical protein
VDHAISQKRYAESENGAHGSQHVRSNQPFHMLLLELPSSIESEAHNCFLKKIKSDGAIL